MHLLYARFFTKALNDMGLVKEREPWLRLFNQGQILGADGERMTKSRGNVQDPDELVDKLRRGHGSPVPDVHGPVGPGRPLESEGHRGRPPLPAPGLDGYDRPAGTRGWRPGGAADYRPVETAASAADELRRQPTARSRR